MAGGQARKDPACQELCSCTPEFSVVVLGLFLGKFWPKKSTSRDGCFLLISGPRHAQPVQSSLQCSRCEIPGTAILFQLSFSFSFKSVISW